MIKRSTKSISFLMEFIIIVFFFAISSAICVNVYAQAESMNTEANDKKTALLLAQNYIESYDDQSKTFISYDENGNEDKQAYFTLQVQAGSTSEIKEVVITCKEKQLVSLQFPSVNGGHDYEE